MLCGEVQVDDGYLGGKLSGSKAGRVGTAHRLERIAPLWESVGTNIVPTLPGCEG